MSMTRFLTLFNVIPEVENSFRPKTPLEMAQEQSAREEKEYWAKKAKKKDDVWTTTSEI